MKCNKAQEWISLQLDSQLAAQHVALLQEHLDACADCRVYCDDLLVGRRMLAATNATLPEDFDWKLQLRLNQVMREAAREVRIPWRLPMTSWRRWMSRAGVSAVMGLTAVLLIALVLPERMSPTRADETPLTQSATRTLRVPVQAAAPASLTYVDANRRPLDVPYRSFGRNTGFGFQRQTSTGSGLGGSTFHTSGELQVMRIRQLERELEVLRRHLGARDRQIQLLEARLDSLGRLAVDRTTQD